MKGNDETLANELARDRKSSPENSRKTADANFARGDQPSKYPRKSEAAKPRLTKMQSEFAKAYMSPERFV